MAIVPQDSFVFQGSLRSNLDPFKQFSDSYLTQVLEKINFAQTLLSKEKTEVSTNQKDSTNSVDMDQFENQETKSLSYQKEKKVLDFEISSGGKNLSLGQKQLICIARALIEKPQILLMDEATSNIDEFTDGIIQQVIKEKFKDVTIGRMY